MKRIAILVSVILVFNFCVNAEKEQEEKPAPDKVVGTYDHGKKKVTVRDIELFKEVAGSANTPWRTYIYPAQGIETPRDCFAHIAAERIFARQAEEKGLHKEEEIQKELDQLKEIYKKYLIEEYIRNEATEINEKKLEQYYSENADKYSEDDKIKISMIFKEFGLTPSRKEKGSAKKLISDISNQLEEDITKFAALAREHSDSSTARMGGEVGWLERNEEDLNPEVFQEIWNLETGELSEIMELPTGYALILLKDKREDGLPPLKEKKDQVVRDYRINKLENLKNKYSEGSEDFENKASELMQAPENQGKWEFIKNGFFTRKIIQPQLDAVEFNNKDYRSFFYRKRKFFRQPMMWEIMAVKVTPEKERMEKDRIHAHYALKDAEKKAEKIAERLKNSDNFMEAASEYSDDPNASDVEYFGWVSERGNPVISSALQDKTVGDVAGPVRKGNEWWIAQILRIRDSKQLSMADARETIADLVRQNYNRRTRWAFYMENLYKSGAEMKEEESESE